MEHTYFFDGNEKRIAWVILNNEITIRQKREHVQIYDNKISTEQSKYIALHVGIFWCMGKFIIKNKDSVKIMLDLKSMYEQLTGTKQNHDSMIESRIYFINQLIRQRDLKIKFELIGAEQNLAKGLLSV